LGVTAAAENLADALQICYQSLQQIHWPGMQFRTDIGRSSLV
jgi:phosphoribosylamine-glycine ligase